MSVSNILPSVASDWNVLFSFYRSFTDDSISDSFLQDQNFLKFRSLFMRSLAAAVNLSEDTHPTRLASWLETLDFALSYEMVAEMQFSVVNLTHEVGTLIGGKGLCLFSFYALPSGGKLKDAEVHLMSTEKSKVTCSWDCSLVLEAIDCLTNSVRYNDCPSTVKSVQLNIINLSRVTPSSPGNDLCENGSGEAHHRTKQMTQVLQKLTDQIKKHEIEVKGSIQQVTRSNPYPDKTSWLCKGK